jgi:exodeoxyribonuclease VII small subunit
MAGRTKKTDEGAEPSFEQRLEALESIVRDLEGEGVALEQSLARYQEGVAHVNACRAILDAAEKRLLELVEGPGGAVRERALKAGEQGLEPDGGDADGGDDGDRGR